MKFEEYINEYQNINPNLRQFSCETNELLKTAYEKYDIEVHTYYSSFNDMTELEIKDEIEFKILKMYKIQFHNVGSNPYQRFYKYGGHYEWLKTLHVIVSNLLGIVEKQKGKRRHKSQPLATYLSNKTIALKLEYFNEKETNKEVITKGLRKVTDSLAVLKQMNLITVNQIHNPGRRGSRHIIRVNWLKVIDLFSNNDYNAPGSIRFRKAIRYRIISFLRKTNRKFSNALRKLMQKQETSYLRDVITFNLERFQEDKFLIFKLLSSNRFKCLAISKSDLTTKKIVPVIKNDKLIITCKSKALYNELTWNNYVANDMQERYNLNVSVIPSF